VLGKEFEFDELVTLREEIKRVSPARYVARCGNYAIRETWAAFWKPGTKSAHLVKWIDDPSEVEDLELECSIHKSDDMLKYGLLVSLGLLRRFGIELHAYAHALDEMVLRALHSNPYSLIVDSMLLDYKGAQVARKRASEIGLAYKIEQLPTAWQFLGGLIGIHGSRLEDVRTYLVMRNPSNTVKTARCVKNALIQVSKTRALVKLYECSDNVATLRKYVNETNLDYETPTLLPLGAFLDLLAAR